MLSFVRNILLFSLVTEQHWPETLGKYQAGRMAIAWTADSAGLFEYQKPEGWPKALEAWRAVKAANGRPLSEALRFPPGFIGDHSLYLSVLHGITGPVRWKVRDQLEYARGESRARLEAYYELVSLHYRVYDLLDDLGRDSVPLWAKRCKLAELYEILGPEMYHAGMIPQPLP